MKINSLLDKVLADVSVTHLPDDVKQESLGGVSNAVTQPLAQAAEIDRVIAAELLASSRLPLAMEQELEAAWSDPELLEGLCRRAVAFLDSYRLARDARGRRPASLSLGGAA